MAVLSLITAALALSATASAHAQTPEEIRAELDTRDRITAHSKRALDRCAGSPAALALKERAIARRAAKVESLRQKRGLKTRKQRRDEDAYEKYLTISHDATAEGYTLDTPLSTIFDSNATCALVPEVTIGPYYVEGELIRVDITDGQSGVPSHLDIQFVDINTCEAVPQLLIDAWHCNATGTYSGVDGEGGLNTTFNRGVQQTDSDGVVQFDTNFPGHYTGRATHIHLMSTANATILGNGTFTGGTAQHIGQMFFDTALRDKVEAVEPYASNTQTVTTNDEDSIAISEATDEYDPFMKYVLLGDDITDGLLMWMTVAIDTTANYDDEVSAAAHYYKGGGVSESSGSAPGGGNGTGPGNGTAPDDGSVPTDLP